MPWPHTILLVCHPNMDRVRISISGRKRTEDGRVPFYAILVNGFRRAPLQCEGVV